MQGSTGGGNLLYSSWKTEHQGPPPAVPPHVRRSAAVKMGWTRPRNLWETWGGFNPPSRAPLSGGATPGPAHRARGRPPAPREPAKSLHSCTTSKMGLIKIPTWERRRGLAVSRGVLRTVADASHIRQSTQLGRLPLLYEADSPRG